MANGREMDDDRRVKYRSRESLFFDVTVVLVLVLRCRCCGAEEGRKEGLVLVPRCWCCGAGAAVLVLRCCMFNSRGSVLLALVLLIAAVLLEGEEVTIVELLIVESGRREWSI